MNYLGYPQAELEAAGGVWTAREIAQQPAVWPQIEGMLSREAGALRSFLGPLLERGELRILLTGAGTSAFVGECVLPALQRHTRRRVDAIATTDLVGSPDSWLDPAVPTLLVSFARSGNSPESLAALTLAEQCLRDCHHLIFTCNSEGALYGQGRRLRNGHMVLLPQETNDRGLAMTSSFSGMMLAAALAFDLAPRGSAVTLARWATHVLTAGLPFIAALARCSFERVAYLGGAEFKGLAREAALKMLELNDGKVVAFSETPLGFRHGPKAVVNTKTLVVMFLSNDPYSRQYDMDLLRELRADGVAARVVTLSSGDPGSVRPDESTLADGIVLPGATDASNLSLCFPYVVCAQMLATLKSMALGLRPDTPNDRGVVNRVVQGVSIYPWTPSR
jgi:tagatose-6-phosphate ketose/aldose isomerase